MTPQNTVKDIIVLLLLLLLRYKPFAAAVQHSEAVLRQRPGQSWYHRRTPVLVAVMLAQASLLLDAAPMNG